MASNVMEMFDQATMARRLAGLAKRLAGVALLGGSLWLGLALFGFTPSDPTFNHAVAGEVANPAGAVGAGIADLLLQVFGRASWILPLIGVSWGLRMALARPLPRLWLPLMALPLALLAATAFLAARPLPDRELWPFNAGLGGFVGDLQFLYLQPHLSADAYFWSTAAAALILTIAALGLRWRESFWALDRMGAGSAWVGRRVGYAASTATHYSGRAIGEGWQRFDARRRARAPAADAAAPRRTPPPADEEDGREEAGLVGRVTSWFGGLRGRRQPAPAPLRKPAPPPPAEGGDEPAAASSRGSTMRRRRRDEAEDEPTRQAPTLAQSGGTVAAPAAVQESLPFHEFRLPDLDMLTPVRQTGGAGKLTKTQLDEISRQLETVLDDFGVRGEIVDAKPGPVVTLFELEPAPGTRAARVTNLADDIARSLCALSVRVAVVPGRNVIGIELPNEKRDIVYLREIFDSPAYAQSEARLALALGKDISGNSIIVDLARMPHLLIAGTTGSGKSVAINSMILSLLYRLTPEQCRIIMIDPKVIELSVYEDIPHLLSPVVTEPHKAVVALKWVVRQMDERYRLMSHLGVRDIFAYNKRIEQARARGEQLTRRVRTGFEPGTGQPIIEDQPIDMTPLPLIVVIVDEVADLMLTAGKEIEAAIQRLSQKARAAGVHLIVATQRPSVDVLTGVIKANLPSRISFRVSSKIDSRTILGEPGAEQLLGQGDMLYLMPGDRIMRVHGPLVTDNDVERVVGHLKAQGEPDYVDEVTQDGTLEAAGDDPAAPVDPSARDGVYEQAVQIVARDGKASTSYLQRKLSIGYNSAAKLIEKMEAEGLISTADHVGRRQVLMGRGGVDGTERTDDDDE